MDLHSGLPYWIIRNSLWDYFHPLEKDLSTDVVIVGSGITGALMAHELCHAGIKCCIVDKRSIATGSSAASTALLQYEIDVPLCRMAKIIGEENAATAYHACLQSISDIKRVLEETGVMPVSNNCPASFMPVVRRITNFWNKNMKYGKNISCRSICSRRRKLERNIR